MIPIDNINCGVAERDAMIVSGAKVAAGEKLKCGRSGDVGGASRRPQGYLKAEVLIIATKKVLLRVCNPAAAENNEE